MTGKLSTLGTFQLRPHSKVYDLNPQTISFRLLDLTEEASCPSGSLEINGG